MGDAGIEPALSRLRVECICHLCQSPLVQEERIELSPRDYRSRARPSSYSCNCWCAVRELNPHLLGVGQLFWSVELPAQNLVEGTGVEPVWPRQSGAEVGISHCPSPEAPPWWLAMDSNHPRRLYESRVLPTELASQCLRFKLGWPGRIRTCAWRE